MKPLLLFLLLVACVCTCAQSRSIISRPESLSSLKINKTQNGGSCFFAYTIRTSCSSPRFTRDRISVAFGDAYGNQIYASRLEDPDYRTFERCGSDTFDLYAPCTNEICYMYVYRQGSDGWVPYDITVYAYKRKAVTFHYDVNVPNGTWYGFNHCSGTTAAVLATE